MVLLILGFIVSLSIEGCTVVRVQGANATVTHRYIGIANVQIAPTPGQSALVVTEGLGAVSGPRSATLGWMKETLVVASDLSDCRAYIVVENDDQLKNLSRAMSGMTNLCIFTKESNSWQLAP